MATGRTRAAGSPRAAHRRAPIISAAARNNVPAVYEESIYARDGGLLSYAPDQADRLRRAAAYVDRILRGEKPGDLPVQFPTKFKMVVNRKTAKALVMTQISKRPSAPLGASREASYRMHS
jgi:putative ABC transport system substrate-binding protein